MTSVRSSFLLGAAFLWAPAMAEARVWYVKPDGTGDAPTVLAGIDSVRAGDVVLLAAGTYTWTAQGAAPP